MKKAFFIVLDSNANYLLYVHKQYITMVAEKNRDTGERSRSTPLTRNLDGNKTQ